MTTTAIRVDHQSTADNLITKHYTRYSLINCLIINFKAHIATDELTDFIDITYK